MHRDRKTGVGRGRLAALVFMLLVLSPSSSLRAALPSDSLTYRVEASATVSDGDYAPLWLTAGRYGMGSSSAKSAYLRAGASWRKDLKRHRRIEAVLDLAAGSRMASKVWVEQAYADLSWKSLTLSVGSKERAGFPLEKNARLTSGWTVEGPNARPIPQVRLAVADYLPLGFTGGWLSLKGHLAYGFFTDGGWQEKFVAPGEEFTRRVLYHSKSLMFRVGNRAKFPLEFELGLQTAAQFGGQRMRKEADGSVSLVRDMPSGLKSFWKVLVPRQESTLANVEGNHCGSWDFGLNYYAGGWRFRAYLEHYFEDHSQMFFQYGPWKDGQLGLEVTFPPNRWVRSLVWEGLNTTDQTGPVLYDGAAGSFTDLQMSGRDNYYTNMEYLGWQHYGSVLGHPFLLGPQYNTDGKNAVEGSRVRAQHVGLEGSPSTSWSWRLLLSYIRCWGTYDCPFDEVKRQFSGLAEATFRPGSARGWSFTLSLGVDRGARPGNSTGCMLTVRKTGRLK